MENQKDVILIDPPQSNATSGNQSKVAVGLSNGDLEDHGLKRELDLRHLCFLALGSGIGTGLFVGSGNILSAGGPGSLLIDFILVGFMVICVMFSISEMVAVFPQIGSYANMLTRFVDPSLGFAIGMIYLLTWSIILPVELTAATIVIGFWDRDTVVPVGVWVAIILLFVFAVNLFGVRFFGEFEFCATSLKMIACIGFIICTAVIDCGGAPSGKYLGAHTWYSPGAFNNSFKGFSSAFSFAALSYGGVELVGVTAAEASHPRRNLPKAIKFVVYRVLIFYVLTLFMITLLVPYDQPELLGGGSNPRASPFVIAIQKGGIYALPSIFNGVILISVISVANAAVYSSSRLVHSMAQSRFLPLFMAYTKGGRPVIGYIWVLAFGGLGFLVYSTSKNEVFNWLGGITGLGVIFLWLGVLLAHIRFRRAWRAQGYSSKDLPWSSPLGELGSWFGVVINVFVLAITFYISAFPIGEGELGPRDRGKSFFESYISVVVVLFFFICHKLITRSKVVKFNDIDIQLGRRDPDSDDLLRAEAERKRAMPLWKRIFDILF